MTTTTPRVSAGSVLVRREAVIEKAPAADTWKKDAIVFSACNEDNACELEALPAIEGKRVLCITAGGGRVLNLLLNKPREICAVDLNPAQNALLELKIAAVRHLEHPAFLSFLGVHASSDRLGVYERIRPDLSAQAQSFWDEHLDDIESGVLFSGRLERFFRRLAMVLRIGHPLGLSELFGFTDLEAQKRFIAKWNTPMWRLVSRNAARRWVLKVFSGDPGFYRYVPEDMPIHNVIYDRVQGHFETHLARENHLMQLVFFGRYIYEPALPAHLNAATYGAVRAALDDTHIEIITATVDDALDYGGRNSFDAFSLSDISSYLDDSAHGRLFDGVLGAARPGARLCSRSNLHHRPLSPGQAKHVRRDTELERRFSRDDHSCVHEFLVGEIV
jgi:S-adenosylmethionine-diacylglycerol 3-amino-3-carboxypropyl transferase